MLVRPFSVYGPQGDSYLLREALLRLAVPPGARVLDVCTGTGLIACAAAGLGASRVWAVDVSAAAVLAAGCNARLRRLPVRARRGDFRRLPFPGPFDVVTANPPYVPTPAAADGASGRARAWEGGADGRLFVDRLCALAPGWLAPGGALLMVHSALCGTQQTLERLRDAGLKAAVVARQWQPFGPVLRARAHWLEERGLIARGQREEELVVVRADRAAPRA